jgi:hypothetical protein
MGERTKKKRIKIKEDGRESTESTFHSNLRAGKQKGICSKFEKDPPSTPPT